MNIGHKNTCHYANISVIRSNKSRINSCLAFDSDVVLCIPSGVDLWGRECVKSAELLVVSARLFPLSVRATFRHEIKIFTQKFTPLSTTMMEKLQH